MAKCVTQRGYNPMTVYMIIMVRYKNGVKSVNLTPIKPCRRC